MTTDKPSPAPRLIGFHVRPEHQLPAPLHNVRSVSVDSPANLAGWGVHIRGTAMFLESPAGWAEGRASGKHAEHWNKAGPRHVYGPIPLANVTLVWEASSWEACEKTVSRYDLPEMKQAQRVVATGPTLDPKEIGDP